MAHTPSHRVRRPVYMQTGDVGYTGEGWSYATPPTSRPKSRPKAPTVDLTADLQTQLMQAGVPGAGVKMPSDVTFTSPVTGDIYTPYAFTEAGTTYDYGTMFDPEGEGTLFKVRSGQPPAPTPAAGPAGPAGPSRQDLIDAAFANLPEYAGYMPEADMQALADYYSGQRSTLENVYAAQRGRIGDVSAQALAALSMMDPQAAFVYDVGGPTIPDVNVDYLRALGASADPVSAEAEFARNLLGYQLAASQRAAEGMAASLERERQARLAASRLMEQEGYTRAEQARAAALADLAARQAREEAVIRERVRQADEERARRDQELAMLRLELDLAGID